MSQDIGDLANDIRMEATELIETLTRWYSDRGGHPPSKGELSAEEINEVFRPIHTLKGLCQMGGLRVLERLLHLVEDRLAAVRDGNAIFAQPLFDLLGDLLRVTEQFFLEFPADPSPQLSADLADLTLAALQLDDTAEPMTAPLQPTTPVSEDAPDLTPSIQENQRFQDFCKRPENLLAAVYGPPNYPNRDQLLQSEGYESLTRVVEIIYERTFAPHGTLLIFASDLDAEMAGSLGMVGVVDLERHELALAGFDAPWSLVAFETLSVGDTSGDAGGDAEGAAAVATKPSQSVDHDDAPSPSNAAAGELPYEDFDITNQGQNAAAMELDAEMLSDFLTNADELLEQLTQSMLDLESDPRNTECVEAIFRAAHTIKGTAGMFGFRAIEKLTHVMENTFDRIRKGELLANSALMDGLLAALDRVRACFESLKRSETAELTINTELNKVLQADYAASHGLDISVAKAPDHKASGPKAGVTTQDAPSLPSSRVAAVAPGEPVAAAQGEKTGEDGKKSKAGGSAAKKNSEVGTIRVDLGRLDALVNLVGELVIDRTRFARIEETLRSSGQNSELLHTMSETLLLFGRHMNDVQSIIMKIRMVPVGNAFYKFTRVVRDLARACGKEIDLIIEGGETELDKTLVEEIGDPLVHLIRNSADHGIETPDIRMAAGKNPRGTITLRAYQDGNMIVIAISDDGRGLAVDRIRSKAVANGLIGEGDALAEKDIFNLIFEPGFSTAEKVTNISGRGVGMDAVKKSITKLKGVIDIDSVQGSGTQITIKLPLTLAIIPSLLVESHGETYAIPLVNVIESIRIAPEEVQRIGHSGFVKLRERVVPLLRLADTFDLKSLGERMWYSRQDDGSLPQNPETLLVGAGSTKSQQGHHNHEGAHASGSRSASSTLPRLKDRQENLAKRSKKPRLIFVVVGVGEQRVGLIVEQLMGQQEIVIKSLGRILGRTRGVSGGCVLGNGRVALVLDVGELIEDHSDGGKGGARAAS